MRGCDRRIEQLFQKGAARLCHDVNVLPRF
jgi:hypothetical protein